MVSIFKWNVPFISLIFLKTSLVFPILLFFSVSLHWSLSKGFLSLFAVLWNSAFRGINLSFSPFLLSQLFIRPPQTTILPFCHLHFFSLGMVLTTASCTMSWNSVYSSWRARFLEGTNKTLCTPRSRRKEQWPHKKLTQTCPWVSRSLQERHGLVVACFRVGGTECSSACMGPFEGGCHYLHHLHHSFPSGQATGREHSPAHQWKIGLKIYWTWPSASKWDPVLPLVSSISKLP